MCLYYYLCSMYMHSDVTHSPLVQTSFGPRVPEYGELDCTLCSTWLVSAVLVSLHVFLCILLSGRLEVTLRSLAAAQDEQTSLSELLELQRKHGDKLKAQLER